MNKFSKIFASIFFICLVSFSSVAQSYYGEKLKKKDEKQAVSADKLSAKFKEVKSSTSEDIVVKGKIVETCKKKGCWMTIDMGDDKELFVKFKDYGFFVPREGVNGKEMIMKGVAKKEVISVDELKHYAEDAGKSEAEIKAITQPKEKYTFMATGVVIK